MSILVLVEHDGSQVKDATLATVTAASQLGDVHVLVAGNNADAVAQSAAKIAGVAKVYTASSSALEHQLAEAVAPVVAKLMEGHDAFLAPATTTGKNIAPRVAALLDVMQVTDILSVEGPDTFTRPIYAGNAIATVKSKDSKKVITVRTTAFEKAAPEGGSASVEQVDAGGDPGTSSFVSLDASESERPELTSAKIIVSGGRAFGSSEQFHSLLDPLADKLGAGVGKVLVADDAAYEHGLAENVAPLIVKLMDGHDAFLAPATTTGKNVAPRVAALLDVMQLSDIISVEGDDTFTRPIYAGNAITTVRSSDAKKVITVRGTAFDKAARDGGSAAIEPVAAGGDQGQSKFVGMEAAHSDRPELTSATIIVSGGRAFGSSDQFHALLDPLADKLGAAVGASRAAVDAGYAPNDYQVGQTGKIVAPQVYIAIGISGAIQHLAGMKDSKVIVAINKDEEAPIFQVADIGLVGDLFKIVPELTEKL
jgi:electron transfer flavoprotein alpha subunit